MATDRAEMGEVHSVSAKVSAAEPARTVIEVLEQQGIPPEAISLNRSEPRQARTNDGRGPALFGDVGRSVVLGAVAGAAVGVALGGLLTLVVALEFPIAAMLGAVFGAGVGGTAGGMSVVKYASPAWRESQQPETGWVTVSVQHLEAAVVEDAERLMSEHEDVVSVSREPEG